MASLALKKLSSANLFTRSLRPMSPALASSRLFSTNANPRQLHPPMISEKEDGVFICLALPGFGKDDVKLSLDVEQNALLIDGECPLLSTKVNTMLDIPMNVSYKIDGITSEMKNGMLKVFLPKDQVKKKKNNTELHRVKVE